MIDKDPASVSLLTYAWVFALAWWGGVVNYLRKLKRKEINRFSLTELIGDFITSGFSGVITYYLCQASELNGFITASLVGMSGHMGSKAIYMLERALTKRFGGTSS